MSEGDDYVECSECGHALERHTLEGCRLEGCSCAESWSYERIGEQRRKAGLPARFARLDF